MKKRILIHCLLLMAVTFAYAQQGEFPRLTGPYLGQKPPGTTPEIFAPDIISTPAHEFSCCFSPDGKEFYFTRRDANIKNLIILCSKLENGLWTEPAIAPFAEPFTFEPFVTPDNQRVYFQSGKVVGGALQMFTLYADRTGTGWSEAKDPGEAFNPMKTMHIASTASGTIYTTDISGGMGNEALGIIKKVNEEFQKLERLSAPLNSFKSSQHPWIAPDESYMIFTVRKPEQNPGSVLYCTFRDKAGKWREPGSLKLGIDAGLPFVSFEGQYLFFTAGDPRQGSDIYWVSAKIIEELRPK